MKKNIILLGAFTLSSLAYSQVGVNTETPKATLDVVASPADATKTDGLIAPRLTGNQLRGKNALYTADQTGTLVYVTAADSSPAGKTVNVTAPGYYYFDGVVWQTFKGEGSGDTDINIYKDNGTLTNTRTVTMGSNDLRFRGDGNVQIGAADTNVVPAEKLDVHGNVRITEKLAVGNTARNAGLAVANTVASEPIMRLTGSDNTRKVTVLDDGNFGIGTNTPTEKLHVAGKARITNTAKLTGAVSPLYVDANGVVGKADVNAQIAFYEGTNGVTISANDFNNGIQVPVTITSANEKLNTIGATITSDKVKIQDAGTYMISGSLNVTIKIAGATMATPKTAWVRVNIQRSTNNGATWVDIAGARPIFDIYIPAGQNSVTILPAVIRSLGANDLLRLTLTRSAGAGGNGQGDDVESIIFSSGYGNNPYTLSITKMD